MEPVVDVEEAPLERVLQAVVGVVVGLVADHRHLLQHDIADSPQLDLGLEARVDKLFCIEVNIPQLSES